MREKKRTGVLKKIFENVAYSLKVYSDIKVTYFLNHFSGFSAILTIMKGMMFVNKLLTKFYFYLNLLIINIFVLNQYPFKRNILAKETSMSCIEL